MVWHDCNTDPPKKSGWYILVSKFGNKYYWDKAQYMKDINYWESSDFGLYDDNEHDKPIKWAEVDLSEVK